MKCPPVGPATREAVVAAVAMAAVTAGVTTGGVVSEVGVTAAETGDSEEVVTGMVDAEGEFFYSHQVWSLNSILLTIQNQGSV